MEGFQVTEIGEKIYCILDAGNSSFYVVEGEEKAAVIDTGITAGTKILPVIRELTDKPLLLVITHAHPDHMYHMDEFDEVYMCHDEKKMDPETLVMLTAGKLKPWEEIHDIRTDSVIPLGGTELAVCQTPGHTPGSVVVLETKQNYLFTGDAIGSGCGVWMQVPGGTSLEEYYDGLVGLMAWLVKKGGRMKFFGGHHTQVFEIDGASGLQSAQPRRSRRSHRPCGSGDPRRKPGTAKQCEAVFERTGPLRVVRPRRNAVLCIADSPKISA